MKTNTKLLPDDLKPRIMKKSEAIRRLGRVIFTDAVKAKWLEPCAIKPGKHRPIASIFFDAEDVERVEKRVLKKEYPQTND